MPAEIHLRRVPGVRALHLLQARAPERFPFLLESAARGPHGRLDLLLGEPLEALATAPARAAPCPVRVVPPGRFLEALDTFARAGREAPAMRAGATVPPLAGGLFLLLGYELAGAVEPVLRLPPRPGRLPEALAVRVGAAVVADAAGGGTWCQARSASTAEALAREVAALPPWRAPAPPAGAPLAADVEEDPPRAFLEGVARIRRYIREGDVFQVNLSRAWRGRLRPGVEAATVYAALRGANPGPFAGLALWGGCAVASSSPERLVRVRGRTVETRPIAGTRPRGAGAADAALSRELLAHPKERAEHVMLIDLERNDLGRVCEPGTVEVSELMVLESYAHVHHIVSNVRGRLRAGVTPGGVIAAVFPGGTITGCPKVRCMEIIAELEREGRGPYTGAMGYVAADGTMDLSILIRTIVLEDGAFTLRAGAGIVADSEPARELEETRHKARGMLAALGAADAAAGAER